MKNVAKTVDYIVVGSGVAGLTCALALAEMGEVLVLSKASWSTSASSWAQGGVAAVVSPDDSVAQHKRDTQLAGDGLCDPEMVDILVSEGPARIDDLVRLGVVFDQENGQFRLGKEGAHGTRRVLHVGDQTGKALVRVLGQHALAHPRITIEESAMCVALIVQSGRCHGVQYICDGHWVVAYASSVALATGGCGYVFEQTSNPPVCTGDGMALALLAGCRLRDMALTQFHPTVFYGTSFLISEAVRGEGGVLRDHHGRAIMSDIDGKDLAARDVVSRQIWQVMQDHAVPHVWLDLREVEVDIPTRFSAIYAFCLGQGIDCRDEMIPVCPAAHYHMGGVVVDQYGATDVQGLYAIGEVANNRVHGANRLASNSLLDGLVFGYRAARHMRQAAQLVQEAPVSCPDMLQFSGTDSRQLRSLAWSHLGIVRDESQLAKLADQLAMMRSKATTGPCDATYAGRYFQFLVIEQMCQDARQRQSVGSHFRVT